MAAIATVTGTAIRPGVSKNNRLYTAETIGRMVDRAQARIGSSDDMPITMLTHHGADDDSTHLVGQLTRIWQEADGSAKFEAVLDDTDNARAIATLVTPTAPGRKPTLKGVSIRGAWLGKVRREQHNGQTVESGSDLELDGLDYTRKPGVGGAGVESVESIASEPRESDGGVRVPITESAPEATVTITEADDSTDGGPFADPGYQADKKKRYDLSTKAKAKAAWSYIGQADNARLYTSAQLKRIRGRIVKALKGYGVTVATAEGWLIDPIGAVSESVAECLGFSDDPGHGGSMSISLTNGPTTVTVSSYCVDPHDLDLVGRAAMAGAAQSLMALDPDMDSDIDVPGADAEDTDSDAGESAPQTLAAPSAPAAEAAPQTPAPETAAEPPTQETEPAMAESITPAPATPGTDNGIDALGAKIDKLSDALAGFVTALTPKPVEAAPAAVAPVVEAAPIAAPAPVAETTEQMIQRMVAEGVKAAKVEMLQESVEQNGPPARKGLVTQVAEHSAPTGGLNSQGVPADWPDKPLHTYTDEERAMTFAPALEQHVFGRRSNA